MESFLVLMKSIIDSWMSPSTTDIAMDMSIAIMYGAGLFFLLLPFLKEYPVSPASGSQKDILKDVKRGQKTKKETATGKGCRDGRKNVEDTKTPSQPLKLPNKQPFLDSTPQTSWYPSQKMDHRSFSQLFSYLKFMEDLIQQKFCVLFWGTCSIFSESVVATAHQLRGPSLAKRKSVRFIGDSDLAQDPAQTKGLPQHSQNQPLPHQPVTPNQVGVNKVQEEEILPKSTPKQTPNESLPWKHGMYSKDTKGYDNPNHQKAITKPPGNSPRGTLHTKAVRPASIHPEHRQMLQHHKEPQNKHEATNVREEQGTPFKFLPYSKLTQVQGHFPADNDHDFESRPQFSQPAQPSTLNSKTSKYSKLKGSVPTEVQDTLRAPQPAASHGASKAHPHTFQRYLSVQRPAFYFQAANPQQSRTIRGIGKGSLQSNTNYKMAKHAPQNRSRGSWHRPSMPSDTRMF